MVFETWSEWLREGHFYSYKEQEVRKYFTVLYKELAHFEYTWEETIAAGGFSGPITINDLETTKENQIWQVIFGILKDVNIYVHIPTDVDRHGIAKRPKQSSAFRNVGHYRMQDSWWDKPSFITEHWLQKPEVSFIAFSCYNPQNIAFQHAYNPVKLNFYIAKCEKEEIGEELNGEITAAAPKYNETLDKLHRRIIPHRPITLIPVRAPARGA